MWSQTILRVDSLSIRFGGVQALSEVSFAVPRGTVSGLIGPNGAGKTTMFNCIAGSYRPQRGEISLLHEGPGRTVLNRLSPERVARAGVARTFQNIRLFKSLSVLDNVKVGRHTRTRAGLLGSVLKFPAQRREEARTREAAMHALAFVGLADQAGRMAVELSYGDQRRLEISRALVAKPRLLLLDEPAAGLNNQETAALADLLHKIVDSGATVFLIEHDMRLVMNMCTHLAVLDHGSLVVEGPPAKVCANERVIEAYLGRRKDHAVR